MYIYIYIWIADFLSYKCLFWVNLLFEVVLCMLLEDLHESVNSLQFRFLLHRISRSFPELPIVALVDWLVFFGGALGIYSKKNIQKCNPHTFDIFFVCFKESSRISHSLHLQVWKHWNGSWSISIWWRTQISIPSFRPIQFFPELISIIISACNVKWLGLRGDDLELIPLQSFTSLKPRDLQIAESLNSSGILQVSNMFRRSLGIIISLKIFAKEHALICLSIHYEG